MWNITSLQSWRLSSLHVYRDNNTVASLCMVFVCQIFAKYLVCAIDFYLDSPISLPISYYRVVLTYNCKAQCKREVCKQYARKARDTAIMPVFSTNCHQAPGRAVATGREVCVRGREWESWRTYASDLHLMMSRKLTSGFDFWSRGHLRVAVVHLPI